MLPRSPLIIALESNASTAMIKRLVILCSELRAGGVDEKDRRGSALSILLWRIRSPKAVSPQDISDQFDAVRDLGLRAS